ncbi:MAG: hypothetical protein WC849_02770 [Candidatus Paceibacterota bacterium]
MNDLLQETEYIPTLEEIKNIFKELLKGQKYKIIRKISDKKGLYLLDIKISKEDGYGCHDEYSYMRKGKYPQGQSSVTGIYLTFFNRSGVPKGGHSVAKFENQKWVLIP